MILLPSDQYDITIYSVRLGRKTFADAAPVKISVPGGGEGKCSAVCERAFRWTGKAACRQEVRGVLGLGRRWQIAVPTSSPWLCEVGFDQHRSGGAEGVVESVGELFRREHRFGLYTEALRQFDKVEVRSV